MKKLIVAGVTTALLLTAGTAAFAASEANDAVKAAPEVTRPGYHQFVDANKDGVCDNWETHHQNGNGYCQYGNGGSGHHRNGSGHCWNDNNSGNAVPQANMMNNNNGYGHHGMGHHGRGFNV